MTPKANAILPPGTLCTPDARKRLARAPHIALAPEDDRELIAVRDWLMDPPRDTVAKLTNAVDDAVRHVLDGARTLRFDLSSPDVDSDERSSLGTKLQYYVLEELELPKVAPLDTRVMDIDVELKTTTRASVMVPPEGQCEVTVIIRVDAKRHRFASWVMRTHRIWLGGGPNPKQRDKKRSPYAAAVTTYGLEIVPWTPLPPEPLRLLTPDQAAIVLPRRTPGTRKAGLESRVTALFGYLPEIVIPRKSILTVGAGLADPLRRARGAKAATWNEHKLITLVGTWNYERALAAKLGLDISNEGWVAVTTERFRSHGVPVPSLKQLAAQSRLHGRVSEEE